MGRRGMFVSRQGFGVDDYFMKGEITAKFCVVLCCGDVIILYLRDCLRLWSLIDLRDISERDCVWLCSQPRDDVRDPDRGHHRSKQPRRYPRSRPH